MKKLIALCLMALFLLAVPAMAAKPVKTTELLNCDMDGEEGYETPVIAEVTIKDIKDGQSVNRMYFSEDYVVFYGQELTLNGVSIEVPEPFGYVCEFVEYL